MTRDDMETIVEYCIHGGSAKGVMEDTNVQANRLAVEEFLALVGTM